MSHSPIVAPLHPLTIEAPATADVGLVCPSCLDTLTPAGSCLNVGSCLDADRTATRGARGATVKAPMAVTRSGNID